jgi:hypothetical protein
VSRWRFVFSAKDEASPAAAGEELAAFNKATAGPVHQA